MVLCVFHHFAVFLFLEKRSYRCSAVSRDIFLWLTVLDQICHTAKLQRSSVIFCFQMLQINVDHQDDLLSEVVKGDHLVKQHQIHILKTFRILSIQSQCRLCIL